jgi:nicotinamide mononucleotide transporter
VIANALSVKSVFFTFLGYPVSYIEFVGTILYLLSVWLISRRNRLTWPIGIVSVLLYMVIFYQIHLYSDMLEQVYYLGASGYGWWYWSKSEPTTRIITNVQFSSTKTIVVWIVVTCVLSFCLGAAMTRVHVWAPEIFTEAASYPYIDALTTIMSLVAMWLMARKLIESWIYWIIVDVIGIWLYFVKDVKFIALVYVILLVLAIKGFVDWKRQRAASGGTSIAESHAV